ncbi:hypothetical protein COT97_03025 [Candidatus Falkowbacteria bacterium CG10_big_fil_rev_8_21_14_0_10_39_11]|uniref:Uncharacterized protein n=1 Tax=Candidatus Falkowbacteria bacterium CG10_big_fil_rev_8_21_14_0_10_39_11 TaxID=1974565 RepID=A0A2H0V4W4_9BACT|nr:MAG: hypothetical protein COT97_03025 [Candidatus Falkowbacteria bacterium CG10_big_fil_rev_8_21_14_0_10_39_11]
MAKTRVDNFVFECAVCGYDDYYPRVTIYQDDTGRYEYFNGLLNGRSVSDFYCLSCGVKFKFLAKFGTVHQRRAEAAAKALNPSQGPLTRGRDVCFDRRQGQHPNPAHEMPRGNKINDEAGDVTIDNASEMGEPDLGGKQELTGKES